jgi:hypothetical protein
MMADFRFPFQQSIPHEKQLQQFLAGWIKAAEASPNDNASFTPLILADMAKLKQPSIDLAAADYDPQQLRFSLFELQLIGGAFNRLLPHEPLFSSALGGGWLFGGSTAYADAAPCSDAKDWLGTKTGMAGGAITSGLEAALSSSTNKAIEEGLKQLGMTASGIENFMTGLTAMGTVSRIWKLVSIYTEGQVSVTLESDKTMQKSLPSEAAQFTGYKATAGVSDEDWSAYKNASRLIQHDAFIERLFWSHELADIARFRRFGQRCGRLERHLGFAEQ